jgi:hypothetical protein
MVEEQSSEDSKTTRQEEEEDGGGGETKGIDNGVMDLSRKDRNGCCRRGSSSSFRQLL